MIRHTVIISGATKGLGRAMALKFVQSGHQVVGLYASDDKAAEKLRIELQPLSSDSVILKHDVSQDDAGLWSRAEIKQATSLVLINNACAPFMPQPFHLVRWEDFETSLNIGLKGSWLCARAVLRPMVRAGHGTIVNVLTNALQSPTPKGFGAYVTAKHAIRGLTLALAAEYAVKGIRIFSISPGFMHTALTGGWDQRLVENIQANAPITDPVDAASQVYRLIENASIPARGEDYLV